MDAALFRQMNRLSDRPAWFHDIATAYAKYGIVLFAGLLVVAWARARTRGDLRAEAGIGWAGLATLVALAIGQLIGHLVDRARPYEAMPSIHVLVSKTTDFSFPSDHALTVGALAVGLWFADRAVGRIALVLAIVMAFVRVYVGAHYPGDVLAGLLIGGLVAAAGAAQATRLLELLLQQLTRIPGIDLITGHAKAGHRQLT